VLLNQTLPQYEVVRQRLLHAARQLLAQRQGRGVPRSACATITAAYTEYKSVHVPRTHPLQPHSPQPHAAPPPPPPPCARP
jgi:hypothetical protein